MTEAITIIQTRRSATGSGLLHLHHSVFKQIKPFSARGKYLPLYAVLFRSILRIKRWLCLHRKCRLEHELFCLDVYNTWSTLYDGPKVSCCSYVIIVRTARPLQTITAVSAITMLHTRMSGCTVAFSSG